MQDNIGPQPAKPGSVPQSGQSLPGGWGHAYSGSASGTAPRGPGQKPTAAAFESSAAAAAHALLMQRQLQQSQAARQAPPTQEPGTQPSPLQGLLGRQPQPGASLDLNQALLGARGRAPTSGPTPTPRPTREPYPQDQFLALSIPHLHHQPPRAKDLPPNYLPLAPSSPQRPSSLSPSQEPPSPRASLGASSWGGSHLLLPSLRIPSLARDWDLGTPRPPSGSPEAGAKQPWYLGIWTR